MQQVLQYAVDAIGYGSLYAMMALGLALIFSVMGLMNFAYGELIMAGGYAMYLMRDEPFVLLAIVTIAVVTIISILMERIAFRPLRDASPITLLVASFGVSVGLQQIAYMTVGPIPKGLPPFQFLSHRFSIGGVEINNLEIATLVTTIVLLAGTTLLVNRTMLGVQLRASTEDFDMARLTGVKANRVIVAAFAITGILAGFVALLYVARQGAVTPTMGVGPLLVAFVGGVIGGLGNIWGATLGGFLLGAAVTVLQASLPVHLASYTQLFAFGAVILILVLRPNGLFARRAAREA
ncbi:MAG: branched-chain amino acid ABC transporter permease [Actinobacteria bacterium]|nr:branched-chain amino acid ABC transporter permease [Actinomycetota bacterium]